MAKETVNGLLSMQKALATRRNQLTSLQQSNSMRRRFMNAGEATEIEDPQYDVKKLDIAVTEIDNALFEIDKKIKESNAKTVVEIDVNFKELMKPVE